MDKRHALLMLLLFWYLASFGQDTIQVMQYNLLYYGNYNSAFANCNESTNNTQEKDEAIRTILNYVKPDILTVNECGATQTILDNFMRHNLNIDGVNYWRSDNIVNYANSNVINHIFYNSQKMELKRHAVIRTSVRDIDAYELYFRTAGLAWGDTTKLVCVVAHLKAGESSTDESKRRAMVQNAMDFIDENYPNDNVLIMGDFNMYSSSESGYRLLTQNYSNHDILFVDPLMLVNGVGNWHNTRQYAPYHTQSTLAWADNNSCHSGGGLDDRFDMILMSEEVLMGFNRLHYVSNSYQAVGNDGNLFNQSVNEPYNSAVPSAVANALVTSSDHLPVTMKIRVNAQLGVDENASLDFQATLSPNPATDKVRINFFNPTPCRVMFELLNLQGQILAVDAASFEQGSQHHEWSLQDQPAGFYLVRVTNDKGWSQTLKLVRQ